MTLQTMAPEETQEQGKPSRELEAPLYLTDPQFKALEVMAAGHTIEEIGNTKVRDSEGFPAGTVQTMDALVRYRLAVVVAVDPATRRRTWATSPKGNETYEAMKHTGPPKRAVKSKRLCPGCGCTKGLCMCADA